jgi:hypothetical protein
MISVLTEIDGNNRQVLGSIELNGLELNNESGKVYGMLRIQPLFIF